MAVSGMVKNSLYRFNDDWDNCHGNNSEVTPHTPASQRGTSVPYIPLLPLLAQRA